jgi:DNA-binding transcriptional LysR family regulator
LQEAAGPTASHVNPLRIASSIDVGAMEVSNTLARFCERNPDAEISLSIGNDLVDPLDRGFDIAIHFRRIVNANLKVEEIAVVECGLYGAPAYLEKAGHPTSPTELQNHQCLGYMFQPSVNDWIPTRWDFVRGSERLSVNVHLRARFNSGIGMRHFAIAGLGLAVLPKVRVREEVASGRLIPVMRDYLPPSITLVAVYPRAYMRNARIVSLVRFLRNELRHEMT